MQATGPVSPTLSSGEFGVGRRFGETEGDQEMRWRKLLLAAAASTAALLGTSANASPYNSFGWDIDNLKTTKVSGDATFTVNFTGTLKIEYQASSILTKFILNDVGTTTLNSFDVESYYAEIDFVGGDITGGSVSLSIGDGF